MARGLRVLKSGLINFNQCVLVICYLQWKILTTSVVIKLCLDLLIQADVSINATWWSPCWAGRCLANYKGGAGARQRQIRSWSHLTTSTPGRNKAVSRQWSTPLCFILDKARKQKQRFRFLRIFVKSLSNFQSFFLHRSGYYQPIQHEEPPSFSSLCYSRSARSLGCLCGAGGELSQSFRGPGRGSQGVQESGGRSQEEGEEGQSSEI